MNFSVSDLISAVITDKLESSSQRLDIWINFRSFGSSSPRLLVSYRSSSKPIRAVNAGQIFWSDLLVRSGTHHRGPSWLINSTHQLNSTSKLNQSDGKTPQNSPPGRHRPPPASCRQRKPTVTRLTLQIVSILLKNLAKP